MSLYKFMKERHTPIERVPHLGFKQSACLGCRQGGGNLPVGNPPQAGHLDRHLHSGDPDTGSPQGLHKERVPPSRYWADYGRAWISILTGH